MALESGTRIGPYEIVAAIGAGGMGEVYRATDSNLGRSVRSRSFPKPSRDAERLARFDRAKTLASSHPNIAHVSSSAGVEPLRDRARRGTTEGPTPPIASRWARWPQTRRSHRDPNAEVLESAHDHASSIDCARHHQGSRRWHGEVLDFGLPALAPIRCRAPFQSRRRSPLPPAKHAGAVWARRPT